MGSDVLERFIDSWGMMGSTWGINTSTARVHALLMVSEGPLSLDEIAHRLGISRGNASMCLKDLRNWGVVRLSKEPGDRRDYYVTEADVWKMFFAIVRERKRREFDPVLNLVKDTLTGVQAVSGNAVETRLKQLEELLTTLKQISERLLANEEMAHSVLSLLTDLSEKERK